MVEEHLFLNIVISNFCGGSGWFGSISHWVELGQARPMKNDHSNVLYVEKLTFSLQ